jgi:hypothetical protein
MAMAQSLHLTSRAASSIFLIGVLVFLLHTPLCADDVCRMDEAAKMAACEELGGDCCQTTGDTTPHTPVPAPPPVLGLAAGSSPSARPIPCTARTLAATGPAAAPAVLQGVGIFTLHASFLI